jgi:hypothetical protein
MGRKRGAGQGVREALSVKMIRATVLIEDRD